MCLLSQSSHFHLKARMSDCFAKLELWKNRGDGVCGWYYSKDRCSGDDACNKIKHSHFTIQRAPVCAPFLVCGLIS